MCHINVESKCLVDTDKAVAAMQDLTSLSAYGTRVRRSAADRIHLAMPNLQKLKLDRGGAAAPCRV